MTDLTNEQDSISHQISELIKNFDFIEANQLHFECRVGTRGSLHSSVYLNGIRISQQVSLSDSSNESQLENFKCAAQLLAPTRTGQTAVSILGQRAEWQMIELLIRSDDFNSLSSSRMHCGHLLLDFVAGICCQKSKDIDAKLDKNFYKYFTTNFDASVEESSNSFQHRCNLVIELVKRKAKSSNDKDLCDFVKIAGKRGKWQIIDQLLILQQNCPSLHNMHNMRMHCDHFLLDFTAACCCDVSAYFHEDTCEMRCELLQRLVSKGAKSQIVKCDSDIFIDKLRQKYREGPIHQLIWRNYLSESSNLLIQQDLQELFQQRSAEWQELFEKAATAWRVDDRFCRSVSSALSQKLREDNLIDQLNKFIAMSGSRDDEKSDTNSSCSCCISSCCLCNIFSFCNNTEGNPYLTMMNSAARSKCWTLFIKIFTICKEIKQNQRQGNTNSDALNYVYQVKQLKDWFLAAVCDARIDAAEEIITELKFVAEIDQPQARELLQSIHEKVNNLAMQRHWIGVCYLLHKFPKCKSATQKSELAELLQLAHSHCSYEAVRQLLVLQLQHESDTVSEVRVEQLRKVNDYAKPFLFSLRLRQIKICDFLLRHHNLRHRELLRRNLANLIFQIILELDDSHRFASGSKLEAGELIFLLFQYEIERAKERFPNIDLNDFVRYYGTFQNNFCFMVKLNEIINILQSAGNYHLQIKILNKLLDLGVDDSKLTVQLRNLGWPFALKAAQIPGSELVLQNLLQGLADADFNKELLLTDDGTTLFQLCCQHQDLSKIYEKLEQVIKKVNSVSDDGTIANLEMLGHSKADLTCLHFACITGNAANVDFLCEKFGFYRKEMDNCSVTHHCLEIAHDNRKLNETLEAKSLLGKSGNLKEKILKICMIIDKIEYGFELPDEDEAQARARLSDFPGSAEFLEQVVDNNDCYLFRCGLRLKVWDPRAETIREVRLRRNQESVNRINEGTLNQIFCNAIELALENNRVLICIDLIKCSQFDIIPTCLQTLLQLRKFKGQMLSDDYHNLKATCKSIICDTLNLLYKDSEDNEKALLFRYIMGEINGGPRFPASLTDSKGRGSNVKFQYFTIFKLLDLADCSEPMATKCMEHLVDRIWKWRSDAVCCLEGQQSTGMQADVQSSTSNQDVRSRFRQSKSSSKKLVQSQSLASAIRTAKVKFYSDLILHLIFLIVLGYHLILMTTTVSPFDYVLAVYAVNFVTKELRDFVMQIWPPNVYMNKEWPTKINFKIWMWLVPKYFTDFWNYFDLLSIALLITGLSFKFQMTTTSAASDLMIAKSLLSTSFFIFSFHTISLMRYFKKLGPTISMIKSQLIRDLIPFMIIFLIIATAFGFFLHGLFSTGEYQASSSDTDFLLRVFTAPYMIAFGEFSSDNWDVCQFDNSLGNQKIWGKSCPQLTVTRLYMSFVIVSFMITANIVLINLLIAKFSLTVAEKQEKARMIWRKSKAHMLKDYKDSFMLPAPFYILGMIAWMLSKVLAFLKNETCCRSAKVAHQDDADDLNNNNEPSYSSSHTQWWASNDVNDYPEDFVQFLQLQASKLRMKRCGMSGRIRS